MADTGSKAMSLPSARSRAMVASRAISAQSVSTACAMTVLGTAV
ncbi:hypothetical protein ACFZBP_02280 [Streptomyces sp. NPDC008086]